MFDLPWDERKRLGMGPREYPRGSFPKEEDRENAKRQGWRNRAWVVGTRGVSLHKENPPPPLRQKNCEKKETGERSKTCEAERNRLSSRVEITAPDPPKVAKEGRGKKMAGSS